MFAGAPPLPPEAPLCEVDLRFEGSALFEEMLWEGGYPF